MTEAMKKRLLALGAVLVAATALGWVSSSCWWGSCLTSLLLPAP